MKKIDVFAEIKEIKYQPLLCKELNVFDFEDLDEALQKSTSFILRIDRNCIAISWWLSPKRTRSYPYARVYDTLSFSGKKVTIIPILKDEGKDGDRDFLQWDTVSLMSLLGVYVIISYYRSASLNPKYKNKITNQRFDGNHISDEIRKLVFCYQSDALHWNLSQLDNAGELGRKALDRYKAIAQELGVEMHSWKSAERRIQQLLKGRETFVKLSRHLAQEAQKRERVTIQPKEHLKGVKAALTIKNYLGGVYYLTCDEVEVYDDNVYLIEGKHTKERGLPSLEDIKDGLLKMVLLTNLENVKIEGKRYNPIPVLKLTAPKSIETELLKDSNIDTIRLLMKEAEINGFRLMINEKFVN